MKKYEPYIRRFPEVFHRNFLINTNRVRNHTATMFINPKQKELNELYEIYYGIRGVVNEEGTLLVWDGFITHQDMITSLINSWDNFFLKHYTGDHFGIFDRYGKPELKQKDIERNYVTAIIEPNQQIYLGENENLIYKPKVFIYSKWGCLCTFRYALHSCVS